MALERLARERKAKSPLQKVLDRIGQLQLPEPPRLISKELDTALLSVLPDGLEEELARAWNIAYREFVPGTASFIYAYAVARRKGLVAIASLPVISQMPALRHLESQLNKPIKWYSDLWAEMIQKAIKDNNAWVQDVIENNKRARRRRGKSN